MDMRVLVQAVSAALERHPLAQDVTPRDSAEKLYMARSPALFQCTSHLLVSRQAEVPRTGSLTREGIRLGLCPCAGARAVQSAQKGGERYAIHAMETKRGSGSISRPAEATAGTHAHTQRAGEAALRDNRRAGRTTGAEA